MLYEFRHQFPRNVPAVQLMLESDEVAMSFADLIENGAVIEVYADLRLVGRVNPKVRIHRDGK